MHADVGEEFLASVLQVCAKDIDGIVDNQETVVIALAEVDGDRGILLVVALQVELLLRGELAGVDCGRDTGILSRLYIGISRSTIRLPSCRTCRNFRQVRFSTSSSFS